MAGGRKRPRNSLEAYNQAPDHILEGPPSPCLCRRRGSRSRALSEVPLKGGTWLHCWLNSLTTAWSAETERLPTWLEVDRDIDFPACAFLYEIPDQISEDGEITDDD